MNAGCLPSVAMPMLRPVSYGAIFLDDSERDLVLESAGWEDYLLKKAASNSDPVGRELFDEVRSLDLPKRLEEDLRWA